MHRGCTGDEYGMPADTLRDDQGMQKGCTGDAVGKHGGCAVAQACTWDTWEMHEGCMWDMHEG